MRALLVDDHAVVREGLRRLLSDAVPALAFDEAATAHAAGEKLASGRWDLVILDLSMPGRGGLDVLKEIVASYPRLPVLVMTMYSEEQYALRAFRGGAAGFLSKGGDPAELVVAVERLLAGGRYVTPSLAELLVASLSLPAAGPAHEELSDRELEVLRMLGTGRSVKEIGHALALSEKTISTYRTRLLAKMGMRTNAEVIRYAIRTGLVD